MSASDAKITCTLCKAEFNPPSPQPESGICCCPGCGSEVNLLAITKDGADTNDNHTMPSAQTFMAPQTFLAPLGDDEGAKKPKTHFDSEDFDKARELPPNEESLPALSTLWGDNAAMPSTTPPVPMPSTTPPVPMPAAEVGSGPLVAVKNDMGNERFGLYDLISKLGSSDVSVTYRAKERLKGRTVVLDVLAAGETADAEEIKAIAANASRARKLDHPNIVKVLSVDKSDGIDYIASNFVTGHSLTVLIDATPPSVGEALEIARTLAEALAYAHLTGIVHGSISPSSVVLDGYGVPHLRGFGMGREFRRMEKATLATEAATRIPLPQHKAPETLYGTPTPRSDVFELGAVLYHMITGSPPFTGGNFSETVIAVDRCSYIPMGQLKEGVAPEIEAIVERCLQKDPMLRYRNAGELVTVLDAALGGILSVSPLNIFHKVSRAISKNAVAFIVASILAGGILAIAPRGSSPREVQNLEQAEAFVASGDYANATAQLKTALDNNGDDAELNRLYALLLWHTRSEPKDIEMYLKRSFELDDARNTNPKYLYEYALFAESAQKPSDALAKIRKIKRIAPEFKPTEVATALKRLSTE